MNKLFQSRKKYLILAETDVDPFLEKPILQNIIFSSKIHPLLAKSYPREMTDIYYIGQAAKIAQRELFDSTGWTVFHKKCYYNELTLDDINDLDKHYIDIPDDYGQTPMWIACSEGNLDVYNLLKNAGSDLHQKDNQNRTLLHASAKGKSSDNCAIAQDLINNGVDPNQKDIMGNRMIDVLRDNSGYIIGSIYGCRIKNRRKMLCELKFKTNDKK